MLVLYGNIDQTLMNSLHALELWNRWIRCPCYNNRV